MSNKSKQGKYPRWLKDKQRMKGAPKLKQLPILFAEKKNKRSDVQR